MSFTKRLVDWTTASGHIKHTTPGDARGDSGSRYSPLVLIDTDPGSCYTNGLDLPLSSTTIYICTEQQLTAIYDAGQRDAATHLYTESELAK